MNSNYYDRDEDFPLRSPLLVPFVPVLTPDTGDISYNYTYNYLAHNSPHQMKSALDARAPTVPLQLKHRQPRRLRKRFTLPLYLAGSHAPVAPYTEVMAYPDSGSDENIISLALAKKLKLDVEPVGAEPRRFSVANGNIVLAIGQVSINCRFAAGTPSATPILTCVFQVFNALAVPLIMGMDFLHETETLSKHTDRLVEQLIPGMQSLRVNSVGSPKRSIMCRLAGVVGYATVDTGSDLDLVSPDFVHANPRSFKVTPAYEIVEFADCSFATTSGVVTTRLSLCSKDEEGVCRSQGEAVWLDFYVLDSLNADILVGQDTIDELKVFTKHTASFIYNSDLLRESGVNIIRHKGRLERQVERGMQKIKNIFTSSSNSSSATTDPIVNEQRENARREKEQSLPELPPLRRHMPPYTPPSIGPACDSPGSPTGATMGDSDEGMPDEPVTGPSSPAGGYFCHHPGCTAPSFQTQFLLDSHASVHRSTRPHYCPVRGCPRGTDGKGFKRKSEMIRHCLDDHYYDYVCPFCPGREHKYPRPEMLKRHVRVHHVDKDKDDPDLRNAILQAGPGRGRRWRGSPTSY